MKPGIRLSKIWCDQDLIELRVEVSDGRSCFSNQTYVGQGTLEDAISSLRAFKDQVYGGVVDIRFGEFGPEYANGAFHARLHFAKPGRLIISCRQESEFTQFGKKEVASRATLYLKSEPVLLDRFVSELQAVATGMDEEAYLEAI